MCFRLKSAGLWKAGVYLGQTASSSDAHVWGTGHCSRSRQPDCSKVCRSSQSYLQDSPPPGRCSIQKDHSRWMTSCKHFQLVWTVGRRVPQVSQDITHAGAGWTGYTVFIHNINTTWRHGQCICSHRPIKANWFIVVAKCIQSFACHLMKDVVNSRKSPSTSCY